MKYIIIWTFILIFISPSVFAGWYVEPFLGYGVGLQSRPYIGSDDSWVDGSGNLTAMTFGVRTGYGIAGLSTGLDFALSSYSIRANSPDALIGSIPEGELTVKSSAVEKGIFVRYVFPQFFSVWFTLLFDNKLEQKTATTNLTDLPKGTVRSGPGFKLGFGVDREWISFNFEFKNIRLRKAITPASVTIEDRTARRTTGLIQFGVSFPMSFFD